MGSVRQLEEEEEEGKEKEGQEEGGGEKEKGSRYSFLLEAEWAPGPSEVESIR
jgi:hypothetical protein